MSSQEPEPEQEQEQEVGGRKKHHTEKKHSKKNVVVVGKVYAEWCGHCQSLKPEWAKMKKHILSKKGRKQVVFMEVEEKQIDGKLRKMEKEYGVKVQANGYPTLFRIEKGKVDYYNGNRQSNAMADWYMRGGNNNHIPELMQDQQGGRGFRYTKKRHMNRFNKTRKQRGFFDFLFGK